MVDLKGVEPLGNRIRTRSPLLGRPIFLLHDMEAQTGIEPIHITVARGTRSHFATEPHQGLEGVSSSPYHVYHNTIDFQRHRRAREILSESLSYAQIAGLDDGVRSC